MFWTMSEMEYYYCILRNKRPERFWNQNQENATFFCYFALLLKKT